MIRLQEYTPKELGNIGRELSTINGELQVANSRFCICTELIPSGEYFRCLL